MAGVIVGTGSRLGGRRGLLVEVALTLALAASLMLAVQAFAVKPYQIPSESMVPTLEVGERIIVDRISERAGADPEVGDVIVFHPPAAGSDGVEHAATGCPGAGESVVSSQLCDSVGAEPAEETFVKRVVGEPGDRVEVVDGQAIVDGEPLAEEWATVPCRGGASCNQGGSVTLGPDTYFVMGDNRPSSSDSRTWGPIRRDWIIGEAVASYWPPNRIGGL